MRCQSGSIAAVICAVMAGPAWADTAYYVRTSGSDTADGLSKETAFRTVQRAVARCTAAGGGYTIYVGPGTYAETVYIGTGAGAAAQSGTAAKVNRVIGDVTGTFTGDAGGSVVIEGGSARDYGVYLDGRNYWRFDRLTIKGQRTYNVYWQNSTGGGIYSSMLHVASGFGVYAYRAADLTISDNTMARTAQSGHVIYVSTDNRPGSVTINANRFSMTGPLYLSRGFAAGSLNGLTSASGGVYQTWAYGVMAMIGNGSVSASVRITNNVGSDCLIGIYGYAYGPATSAVIANNTITGSFLPLVGYGYGTGNISLVNNIITDSAYPYLAYGTTSAGAVRTDLKVKGLLQYNILYSSLVAAGQNSPATGVVNGDPKFMDAAAGDFSLRPGSPARDAGFSDSAPATDVRGRARPGDENRDGAMAFDLGAWEGGSRRNLSVVSWWEASDDSDSNGQSAARLRPQRTTATGKKLTDPTVRGLLNRLGVSSGSSGSSSNGNGGNSGSGNSGQGNGGN